MIDLNKYPLLLLPVIIFFAVRYFLSFKSTPTPLVGKVNPIGDDFEWDKCKPKVIRPFVGRKNFNTNMAIQNLFKTPEEWLLIENTYKDIVAKKSKLISENIEKTISVDSTPRAQLAAKEYYDTVITFMTQRYPQYFIKKDNQIYNKLTEEYLPLNLKNKDPKELLLTLSRNMEEDVVIFVKDDPDNHDEEYVLRATITGFPAGFDPSVNHNQPISVIHGPVPQYKERLQLSMARFFNRLTPQDLWVRHNWSIQAHANHFALENSHAYGDEKVEALKMEDMDFDNACFLRCERQVVSRMPKLRANFMSVRTYLTPMSQIKAEGLGEELIRAIDLLPAEVAHYKRRAAWGEAVKQYLST